MSRRLVLLSVLTIVALLAVRISWALEDQDGAETDPHAHLQRMSDGTLRKVVYEMTDGRVEVPSTVSRAELLATARQLEEAFAAKATSNAKERASSAHNKAQDNEEHHSNTIPRRSRRRASATSLDDTQPAINANSMGEPKPPMGGGFSQSQRSTGTHLPSGNEAVHSVVIEYCTG